MTDSTSLPIDAPSAAALAASGLRFDLVDTSTVETFEPWFNAVSRGFLDARARPEIIAARQKTAGERRISGVWDDTAAVASSPVATVAAWDTVLTVPGGVSVPAWAISAVTVSPTHRRRGIAKAMLTAELRTAKALGIPVAILTVSESTIYSRWGFAPATMTADWTIDSDRARWIGPAASGRVHFVEQDGILEAGHALIERVRLATPGQIEFHGALWERLVGVDDEERAKKLRFLRYDDAHGTTQGFAVYTVTEDPEQLKRATAEIGYLVTATDDAYATLWHTFLEMDLIGTVRAPLRTLDEPVRWLIDDFRAASTTLSRDHLWTRIVDVPAALTARRYHSPAHLVLEVTDDQGFATGRWLLTISADGSAVVGELDGDIPGDADAVGLTVRELSALYLGGVSAVTLAHAGRITELTPGAAAVVDRSFRSVVQPWLSIWF
jgi:predicted acetyltransferase